jgi:hypothetical protein
MVRAYMVARDIDAFRDYYQQARARFVPELVSKLNRQAGPGHRKLSYEPGCGAGEDRFTIRSEPPGATLHVISRWNTLVCESLEIDPYDLDRCKGWRPVAAPSVERVVGDYHYLATWSDGQASKGRLKFADREGEPLVIITPRGPKYR